MDEGMEKDIRACVRDEMQKFTSEQQYQRPGNQTLVQRTRCLMNASAHSASRSLALNSNVVSSPPPWQNTGPSPVQRAPKRSVPGHSLRLLDKKPKKGLTLPETKPKTVFLLDEVGPDVCEDDGYNIAETTILAKGECDLKTDMNEDDIRTEIITVLKEKYPLITNNDFDFVRRERNMISKPLVKKTHVWDFEHVKHLMGTGRLYVRLRVPSDTLLEESYPPVDGRSTPPLTPSKQASILTYTSIRSECGSKPGDIVPNDKTTSASAVKESSSETKENESCNFLPTTDTDKHALPTSKSDELLRDINKQGLSDPVEILRFLQKQIVKGRKLDIESESELIEGETNYITVDRDRILETTFAEFGSVDDFKLTFEVDFMDELAKDVGGPRKEWIRLMNIAIKEKYFDKGLREYLADKYYFVGIMIGIALLQNGQLPKYMPNDVVDQLVTSPSHVCVANLQRGLDVFGLRRIIQEVPVLLHLLRPTDHKLTAAIVIKLLTPKFAAEGSSVVLKEKKLYATFVKYLREVASGRRGVTLNDVLIFVTGAAEEPALGFELHPSIQFSREPPATEAAESAETRIYKFLPTAQTCSNVLMLPVGSLKSELPDEKSLFEVYDLAFVSNHFGRA